ncbi:MAG: glycosyltransferase family 4 protein [Vicinamibacterales bacterium]|nr:glycosyltransferase family 4 protein [Vicinamibacterales bacterium]
MSRVLVHLATFLQGGAGRAVTELALAQQRAGAHVIVAASRTPAPGYEHYPEYLDRLGRAGVRLVLADSTFTRDTALNAVALQAVRQAIAARTPSLIHAHAGVPARLGLTLASGLHDHVPVIQTVHGWSRHRTPAQLAEDVSTLGDVAAVVFPSDAARRDVERDGARPKAAHVVPYGLAPAPPIPALPAMLTPALERQARGARLLVTIGSLTAQKHQRALIDALPQVRQRHDVVAILVGEGPELEPLRARAEELGVAPHVVFTDYLPEAASVLRIADLLVQPSTTETFGLAVVEAFRADVPVVANDIPALRELVAGYGAGWLFDAETPGSLAEVLDESLSAPPGTRAGLVALGRRAFEAHFTLHRMMAGYEGVYAAVERGQTWVVGSG